ncbi:MAG: hypothetical protein K8J09_04710 [Planctomycetes bacterium]|nr:hypothetical protein [Planctomycetota bacterium]
MTTTVTVNEPVSPTDTWTAQLDQLRDRYKHLRPAVLAAVNVLLHDVNISDEDAKARAAAHGVRITAASLNAARTVLSKMDTTNNSGTPNAIATTTTPAAAPTRRRVRAVEPAVDAEALIKQVVGRLQSQSHAEADRLRDAMKKAISLLQTAVG